MKKSGYSVAVIGATGLVGREIVTALAERLFPVSALRAFATLGSIGEEINCGAVRTRTAALDSQSRFDDVDIALFAAGEQVSAEWAERAATAGAVVIDTSGLFSDDLSVPLIVPEVNPSAVGSFGPRRILACPDAVAVAMAVVLSPLQALAAVRRVVATSLESVSGAGRAGIAELERQTIELMSGQDTEVEVFSQRIAFNALAHVGEFLAGGASRGEQLSRTAVRRLLNEPDLPVSVTRVRVPLFYGLGVSINVELAQALSEEAVRAQLRQAPGLLVLDDVKEQLYPTLAESVGNDATYVGRIRQDASSPLLDLWVTLDNTRKGSAVNAVQIAEILVRDHL